MAITTAIGDLFHSVYEMFLTIFGTIYNLISSFFLAIIHFFQDFVNLITSVLGGVIEVAGGVGKFVLGNVVMLGVVSAGIYFYVNNQQQQGRSVKPATAMKKTT
ncbi:hypothetical protein GQ53DRAFT_678071 [Thozetella sp. PMI_491]|nr:hypothetical protein GQ53DRAFT_678071 [Thozetella sp. PMI_491]